VIAHLGRRTCDGSHSTAALRARAPPAVDISTVNDFVAASPQLDGAETTVARVLAVSAAREGTAKRGLAAGIGRALARSDRGRVCVLDADVVSRDVAMRFGLVGPSAAQLADALTDSPDGDPLAGLAREPDGCWVVPMLSDRDHVDSSTYAQVLQRLRTHVDYVVIDAPVGLGMYGRRADQLIRHIDEVLVATSAQPEEVPALINYLNAITRGRVTGEVPALLDVRVVPTVEDAGDEAVAALARKVRLVPVSDALPRLWGRNATLLEDEAEAVPDTLAKLVDELVGRSH
jgi:MinD-like ATPase involved in chromosome partitioning or flagellar assembly